MKTSQKKFFAVLKAIAQARGFRLTTRQTFKWNNGHIREKRTGCCPVVAVARHLGVRTEDPTDPDPAIAAIGLDARFAWDVVVAADYTTNTPLRRKLLRVCGLLPKRAKVAA